MKAIWFLPFTYAAGAEGFALFVPYLLCFTFCVYLLKLSREARRVLPAIQSSMPMLAEVQPAI